ncbi:glycosyl hydrolase [Lentilactobacillus fungorum]|uniref:Glycosyl hydrolase n=1 Tax=Lentilactobacillus fungorum TaxID=2201250 RepID=A0ABQ3VYU5_9LACO|nr:glycoside hydrolase family 3 C-terminal domain-containing protein [Lentilactobacillus fungorum]GHP14080.1 glycosyl hydrolase [Lentilactobacillus fungorum]
MKIDRQLIDQLTLTEKAALVSGKNSWYTAAIDRLGLAAMMVADGPSGLRKQLGSPDQTSINDSVEAVCFPASALTACSFDRELLNQLGQHLGDAARAEKLGIVLGPGVNLKRSPLAGRNFEYFSEDPYLVGELASAYVQGVQSKGVGVSVKHFAANNRENRRFTSSSNMDERTLRELYLTAFEKIVKQAHPATLMCSYNAINGTLNSQNHRLLTDILRDEWDYQGLVMSDWGAVADHPAAIKAGLDLEMPGKGAASVAEVVAAVKQHELSENDLDKAVGRVLKMLANWAPDPTSPSISYDMDEQHEFARKLAAASFVLLKNDNDGLPINDGDKLAVIGELAEHPRYQGSGSSHVNAHRLVTPLEAIQKAKPDATFATGYKLADDQVDATAISAAVTAARAADKVVIFAGYPEQVESEGFDKTSIDLPANQVQLIHAVSQVNAHVIVVLQNGSAVRLPWISQVAGVLETYLAGEAVGEATWDVLSGKVNPAGKLAETFPLRLEDTPSYLTFNANLDDENYREGLFMGYRYYDKKKQAVQFPFGFGLSYTTFEYHDLQLKVVGDRVIGSVQVKNSGSRTGAEVVQIYVGNRTSQIEKPEKALANFVKVTLRPQEARTVNFELNQRAFSWYNPKTPGWQVDNGQYDVLVGSSSADIRLSGTVELDWQPAKRLPVDQRTYIGDLLKRPEFLAAVKQAGLAPIFDKISIDKTDPTAKMFQNMPLRAAITMGVPPAKIEQLIKVMNQAL